ncbi:MAG TPA: M2 family metallopeptidase [Bacteroidia bacterium]|nr:M2 family metallopeptidase [Bacteroidia bacterium]HRS58636.1 M2 family metallopeptidase [Bacteroidia bacterium]HRU67843.1 M2 family metallopeptidase [Bacteroidia bacterium]
MRTKSLALLLLLAGMVLFSSCNKEKKIKKMEAEFSTFIDSFLVKYVPLYKEGNIAYFAAAVSGKDEDFNKASELQIQMSKIFSDKEDFAKLEEFKKSGLIKDPTLARQLDVLYNSYKMYQIDEKKIEEMIKLQTEIEKKFNTYRAVVNGDTLSDNEIEEILRNETNSDKLKQAWIAHKDIGKVVSEDVIRLVKMRNEAAKELGFNNFHEMSLKLREQDPEEILKLFDELDKLTADAFSKEKQAIDEYFSKRYKVKPEELMPWHYQNRFFQEAPNLYPVDLDKYYKDKNLEELTSNYYSGIGLDISSILKNSDLYEKPGKNQHAFCIDIDNEGDVRVLCNIRPNSYWMNTMLHEYGHAVYDKYIDMNLPFILREPAHTFTTEAIAQMFGKMASNPQWLMDMVGIDSIEKAKISEDCYKTTRLEMLVFSRWSQVMYRFEKSLYENPDQDLNKLWWDLVEKYQLLKRPADRNAPDWASKIHIATSPCYYHNYLLGELLSSQLYFYIVKNILKSDDYRNQSFAGKPEVGQYLLEKVFKPGSLYPWNEMIEKATGEKLTPKYYAEQWMK